MKKITFLLAFSLLILAFSLKAQEEKQFPDNSFETGWKWYNDNGGYYEYETEYFYTLNSLHAVPPNPGIGDVTAWRDNVDPKHGAYSIKLVSGNIAVGTGYIFLPGMVGTIDEEFINKFLNSGGNVPVSRDWYGYATPRALEGWYKYNPVAGDSALIDIGFAKDEVEVFVSKLIIKDKVENWTKFSIPIPEQYWNQTFTEIRTLFVASAGVNWQALDNSKGQLGSTLWIDDIRLVYKPNGIEQQLLSTLKAKAFPNPAKEVLNIVLNEHFIGTISIYDLSGSRIIEKNINGDQCQMNIATLSTGNYIYKLMDGNTIFAQGKFVVTK